MNSTHRLSLTLAGLAAAALAVPAYHSTATAAGHGPDHHTAQARAQQTQKGLTATHLDTLATLKRDFFQKLAERPRDRRRHQPGPHTKAST
jgi:hypothetical protein